MHPKPPPPPAVMNSIPWENDLTARLTQHFGASITQFASYLGQNFIVVSPDAAVGLLEYLRDQEEFDFLVDLTAVDYPKSEERFEIVYTVYSFSRNERLRVKTRVSDGEKPLTSTSVYPGANWLEREVFDMFGIDFAGHPDMRRILLPDDWRGHPLRKDYGILQMDNRWVQENLGIESGQ
jgi:NADH-quinone oxidoreductase subunit C